MIWGDTSKFAIETTVAAVLDGCPYGPFLVWVNGLQLGDPDDFNNLEACFGWVQQTINDADALIDDTLYSSQLSMFALEYSSGSWPQEWYKFSLQIWLMSGADRYGDNLMLIRDSGNSARIVWASDRCDISDTKLDYHELESIIRSSVSGFKTMTGAAPSKHRILFTADVRHPNLAFNVPGLSVALAGLNIAARVEGSLRPERLGLFEQVLEWIRRETPFKAFCFLLGSRAERSYLPDRSSANQDLDLYVTQNELERRLRAQSLSFGDLLSERVFTDPEFRAFNAVVVDEIDEEKLGDLEYCSSGVVILGPCKHSLREKVQELVNIGWKENRECPPPDEVLVLAAEHGFLIVVSQITTNPSEVYTVVLGALESIEKLRSTPMWF